MCIECVAARHLIKNFTGRNDYLLWETIEKAGPDLDDFVKYLELGVFKSYDEIKIWVQLSPELREKWVEKHGE